MGKAKMLALALTKEKPLVGGVLAKVLLRGKALVLLLGTSRRRACVLRSRSRMLATLMLRTARRRVCFLRMVRRIAAKRAGGRMRACLFARCALLSVASRVSRTA